VKERFSKRYRHPDLDRKLTSQRTNAESRSIVKVRRWGLDTPAIYYVDEIKNRIFMEKVEGPTVKEILYSLKLGDGEEKTDSLSVADTNMIDSTSSSSSLPPPSSSPPPPPPSSLSRRVLRDRAIANALGSAIGISISLIHEAMVIHGDLTTSNMMIRGYDVTKEREAADAREKAEKEAVSFSSSSFVAAPPIPSFSVTMIDFGLSSVSHLMEDRAVDLYVLERAFLSTHPNTEEMFAALLKSYSLHFNQSSKVLTKLNVVRQRGRKRQMIG